jgi:hypothetical protein
MVWISNRAKILISVTRSSAFRWAKTCGFLSTSRPAGNSFSCMAVLLSGSGRSDNVMPEDENIYKPARTHQVCDGPQHTNYWNLRKGSIQIRPRSGDQRCAGVGQRENQMQQSLAVHPTEDTKSLPFERVFLTDDTNVRRQALDVGSLSYGSSTVFHAKGSWHGSLSASRTPEF